MVSAYGNASYIPSYSGYSGAGSPDWTSMAGADTAVPGMAPPKKKKKKRADSAFPSPGQSPSGPSGLGGTPSGGTTTGTDPSTYNNLVNQATMTAPKGSLAAAFPGGQYNPFSLSMVAQNPGLQADELMSQRFGLPAGSNTANELATIFDPYSKVYGLGGAYPTSNVDWINLGASLMGGGGPLGQATGGAQLDPHSLMTNMVSSIVSEVNNLKSGGQGASDQFNPLSALAKMPPDQALSSFTDMVKGMLTGTMPDQEITAYTNWLKTMGAQFVSQFVHGNAGQMEADGASFITFLVQQLGPALGL